MELDFELLALVLDQVAHLGEVELLLEQRLLREHELLRLELVFDALVAIHQRLHLLRRFALLARELLARRLALVGRADRLLDVDDSDLDRLVLRGGAPGEQRTQRQQHDGLVDPHAFFLTNTMNRSRGCVRNPDLPRRTRTRGNPRPRAGRAESRPPRPTGRRAKTTEPQRRYRSATWSRRTGCLRPRQRRCRCRRTRRPGA